ncbi:MAG TPA: carbohydrate porin [Acetobacteraceae bacterium]|jgi:porin|nr:carbohydrate porin [Acetobacteraceae bacterium]
MAWVSSVGPIQTALAAPPMLAAPSDEDFQSDANGTPGSFLSRLNKTNLLLGDMGGLRTELSKYGMSLAVAETSEVLGNHTGGSKTGAAYDGLTQMLLQLDTARAFGLHGGLMNVSALWIHGTNLSTTNLQTIQTASGIEADRSLRLWEAWYQQKFLDEDRMDVRIGQQSLDQEFMTSQNASYFVNTMFGWPVVPSYDLPGGGPAYPLSGLGGRIRWRPIDPVTVLLGVFSGSPVSSNTGDPQVVNPSGVSFPVNRGVMVIGEIQYSFPALGSMISADEPEPLARTYKLGFWYNSENFADQLYDNTGLPLAAPSSNGVPLNHHGNFSIYAVADQLVWVDPHEGDRTVNLFGRVTAAPQANRNLITLGINAGVTVHEPFLHRDNDTFGIAVGFAKVSGSDASLDKATAYYTGAYVPVRGSETFIEATYQYQATPWWQIQPDIQYVFTPGGGLANPNDPTKRIGNELIVGVRTNILF